MCGICGKVSPDGVGADEIRLMAATLVHRGPDDEGIYVDGTAGLGHRRLAIIDLEHGHQPLGSEDGALWIVFNGEIYNYRELRARLAPRHRFRTDSDTEVLLRLYAEAGPGCVRELRGMFAFAIWDARRRRLVLARDHLGQKPLFYVHRGRALLFASEIKALLAADPALRRMDPAALHEYLALRVITPPRTMFADVRKLPPASILTFADGGVTIERYWSPRYEPKLRRREADLLDELEQRVLETVRYHLVSDVPVGAFLSGGMDSSLVVAMMRKATGEPIKTFAVGVPYRGYSELPWARLAAATFGTEHFEETIRPSLVRVLPEVAFHLDEPSDPLSVCMYHLAAMARREVKVVLGGDGGDELFGGYDRYYAMALVAWYALLPRAARAGLVAPLLRHLPDGAWYKSWSHRLKWLDHLARADGGRRYARSLGYFYFTEDRRAGLYGARLRRELGGFDPEAAICRCFDAGDARALVDRMLYADSMLRLPDHSMMILDRTAMAHGLEARSPFLDHTLVEFCARVPARLKVRGRTRRYLQRRLAARHLPRPLLERGKQGFSSPLPYLLAEELERLSQALLADSHLAAHGWLEPAAIARLLAEHRHRRADHGNRLWLLLNAELWYRMAIEEWSRERVEDRLLAGAAAAG
jgi:asparagine synthase (glutamine-hydrolysing)